MSKDGAGAGDDKVRDRYGLPLTTRLAEAAALYGKALDRYLERRDGVAMFARQALERDEDFAFAWLLLGLDAQQQGDFGRAGEAMAKVRALADRLSERESSALATLALIGAAPVEQIEQAISQHLDRWPLDALVLVQTDAIYGVFDPRADRIARQLALHENLRSAYADDWFILGELAFSYGESGDYPLSRATAERALEANSQNAGAAHAYAHALLEMGEAARAAEWLAEWLGQWDSPSAGYGSHLVWHEALSHFLSGDVAEATARLDRVIDSPPFSALTDGASLAWRMHLAGDDVMGAAHKLLAVPRLGNLPFLAAHLAFALAMAGDGAGLEALAADIAANPVAGHPDTAGLVRAIRALADADYPQAAHQLEALAPSFRRFGGSFAQTEIFDDTLVHALSSAGRVAEAGRILERRIARRSTPRDAQWLVALRAAADGAGA